MRFVELEWNELAAAKCSMYPPSITSKAQYILLVIVEHKRVRLKMWFKDQMILFTSLLNNKKNKNYPIVVQVENIMKCIWKI